MFSSSVCWGPPPKDAKQWRRRTRWAVRQLRLSVGPQGTLGSKHGAESDPDGAVGGGEGQRTARRCCRRLPTSA
uniref:Uncharacterized protein n=1 Tax=Arundo donax TaxID=35708 RepID=A0A0A9AW76_ARUDO